MTFPCPFCQSVDQIDLPCDFPHIRRCKACDFIFANPESVKENPASYESNFAEHANHPTYHKINGEYIIKNRNKLSKLLKRIEPYRSTGKILDFGCSAAFFLKLAKEHGWQPQGAEISEFGSSFSNKELGIDVFHGTVQEANFDDNTFDVVFSSHVMEHIEKPLELLMEIHRILRPGGAIVTVIPTQFSAPSYKFWNQLYGDGPPRHVSFYDKRSYEGFLSKAGFNVKSTICNIELDRLKQLLTKGKVIGHLPGQTSDGKNKQHSPNTYGAGISALKSIINFGASRFGIADEMLVIAEK